MKGSSKGHRGAGHKMAPRNPGFSPNKVFLNAPLHEVLKLKAGPNRQRRHRLNNRVTDNKYCTSTAQTLLHAVRLCAHTVSERPSRAPQNVRPHCCGGRSLVTRFPDFSSRCVAKRAEPHYLKVHMHYARAQSVSFHSSKPLHESTCSCAFAYIWTRGCEVA